MTGSSTQRWAVVGGGMLGMLLAHRLAQAGRRVTLFEAAPALGGLASVWQLGDVTWDRHYHVIVPSDLRLRAVLAELGLDEKICWVQTKVGFSVKGKLYSMSSAMEFLRFPPLNLYEKLRLGATIALASRMKDWNALESELVEPWLRRWSGNSVTEKMWIPLLRAKLGENFRKTSAAFIWGSIQRMYSARRDGAKKETFGYVPGGYASILESFHRRLEAEGVVVRLQHTAQRVERTRAGEVQVSFAHGHAEGFDQAVLCMAAPIAARLCPALSPEEKQKLNGIQYLGIICASLLLKKPLAGYYVTNLTDAGAPYTGVIEMTALADRAHFGGNTLVYLPKYVSSDDAAFGASDDEIRSSFLAALFAMHPHLTHGDVLAFQLTREKYVMAIPTLHYSQRLPPMRTSVPGVHIVNSAHILDGTLTVDASLRVAEAALPGLLNSAGTGPS